MRKWNNAYAVRCEAIIYHSKHTLFKCEWLLDELGDLDPFAIKPNTIPDCTFVSLWWIVTCEKTIAKVEQRS